MPSSWSPLLLAQLLIVLKELLNLHPLVRSPLYQTKFSVCDSFKIWDPPHSTLGSSVMLSPATLKVFSSCSSKLVTIPRLRVPSPKLGVPRSGSETKLSNRHFSCRVLPPQLAATADVWKGVFNTAVQRSLQSLSGSLATVPLINRGVRRKEQKAQTQTAQRLEAICLNVCYRIPSDEQQPHRTTDQCSSPFTKYSQIRKYADLIPF